MSPVKTITTEEVSGENQKLSVMTIEEVSENDGKDGRNANDIVDGIVYNVTDSARWKGGLHNSYQAGRDLTEEINEVSPHGIKVLENIPKVGRIEK